MNARDIERLWSKIERRSPDECWPWLAARRRDGYGVMRVGDRTARATRLVWEAVTGEAPGQLCLCHRCDNPPCCNPAHLFLGTRGDNLRDMTRKGRHGRGNLKLPDEAIGRVLAFPREPAKDIAREFCVSASLIFKIRAGTHRYPARAELFELRRMPGSRRAA